MLTKTMMAAAAMCIVSTLASPAAWGKPQHKESLGRYYGTSLDAALKRCATCHVVPQGVSEAKFAESEGTHNPFGKRLREIGEQLATPQQSVDLARRLKAIADEDSDGDGIANEVEILAGSAPGVASQMPSAEELARAIERQREFRAIYRWEAWQPVRRPAVPDFKSQISNFKSQSSDSQSEISNLKSEIPNPIDAFVFAEHAKRGLTRRPEASKAVLLRRVYLDLIGLPPTAEERQAYLNDTSPGAYDKVVDRLLQSPQYGERWGRHWMDVWRYSDWAGWGAQVRDSMPHVWRWRDWIIESLNADKPYDRMIAEMLAADELCPEDSDALRATGFLVRNYKRLSREQWMQDTVNHTAKAFLGVTLDCCRCHDHMYDTISQDEYYRFRAIFEPYNVRTDRVPGQINPDKDGLVRVFDAELAVPTYFFVRGDERQLDKNRVMTPGVPAWLGNSGFAVQEISLPQLARIPDKRPFVIEDDLKAAAEAFDAAKRKFADVQRKRTQAGDGAEEKTDDEKVIAAAAAAQREFRLAELDAALAKAKHMALDATIRAEQLEDQGVKQTDSAAWEKTAKDALAAQRRESLLEKQKAQVVADDAAAKANAAKTVAETKLAALPDDAKLKSELDKAAKAAIDAQQQLAAANEALRKTVIEVSTDLTTDYKKRTLATYPDKSTGRRLALARWLGDTRNPLTARVAVNQIWMRHFGQPLVPTVFDFGNNGQPPTHPALLDWLAAELMQPTVRWVPGSGQTADGGGRGVDEPLRAGSESKAAASPQNSGLRTHSSAPAAWSMKHLHRIIVTSTAYRMASTPDADNAVIDPDNRFLWRMPPRRMEAELVRDCVLQVAGRLDLTRGGPDLDYNEGLKVTRRSLYFRHAPEKQMTFLRLFDAASPNDCYRRKESIVPQQALALANSSISLEAARRIARHLQGRHTESDAFVRVAFEHVLSRPATADEIATCLQFLGEQHSLFDQNAQRLTATSADPNDVAKPAADHALRARENLIHVLLNHHDFVTIH